ncbi:MAG: hypothetical protein R3E91_03310 [Chlamydiales bacterium]
MHIVTFFGEAEKGEFKTAYFCKSLEQLSECLGEPPSKDCLGLQFAIQAILLNYRVLFFRVSEEGYSRKDYDFGLNLLIKKEKLPSMSALCLPGVGDAEILEQTNPICKIYKSILIITEKDLYDYFTN